MRIFFGDNGGWVWGRWIECYFIIQWYLIMMMIIIITVMVMVGCILFFLSLSLLSCPIVCVSGIVVIRSFSLHLFICSLVRVLPFRSLKKHSIQFNSLSYTHSVNDNNQYRLGVVQFNSNSRNRNDTMMMMMMMNRVFCLFRLLEKWNYFVRH